MHRLSSYLKLRKNVFENVRKQTRVPFGSTEEHCEHIGRSLCAQIDSGALTVEQVVTDSVKFALINARDAESRYFSWLTLHMSLGICFQYHVEDKELIRHVLGVLLPLSHGVDYGIFLRDLLESARQPDVSSVINLAPRQSMGSLSNVPDKSLYYLKYSAGLKIDLRDPKLKQTIFDGTGRAVWAELLDRETCLYIDLPIAHAHLQPMMIHQPLTASLQVSSILLAIMNMKPNVVHLLLRYGASAQGPPLRYLLRTLGTIHLFPGMQKDKDGPKKYTIPVLMVADSLKYTLRTVPYVRFKTEMETIGNNARHETYYVKPEVLQFVPSWTIAGVPPLKHMCRCFIRNIFISLDQLPDGIQLLDIPLELRDYIDIKC